MTETQAARWEGATAEDLASRWGLPAVRLFEQTASTSDVARRLAADGAPEGTLVLAERQLSGRGRSGRGWDSPPGLGLWFSMVVRPRVLPAPGALPLVIGLTVAQALDPFLRPAAAELKWPNDLLATGRKVGGILCEGAWERERPSYVVVGIGLNVLHAPLDFPEELRGTATSVRIAAGWHPSRLEVATAVVRALGSAVAGPLELTAERLAAIEARDPLRGREVVITDSASGEAVISGTSLGVSPEGALLLRTSGGSLRVIHSGTARLAA